MDRSWTPEQITEMIVSAFRRPGGNIASPAAVSAALAFHLRFPGLEAEDWKYLLARCHCIALGSSIEERRRGMGWPRRRFQEGWRSAATAIADGYRREGVNRAAILQREISARRVALTRRA